MKTPGPHVSIWAAFLLSRLWIGVFAYLGHSANPYLRAIPGGYSGVPNWWLNPWTTFDSEWFMRIATEGYEPRTAAFFPLYSMLLSLVDESEVAMALWGVLISNVAFAVSLHLMYRLTRVDYDENVARFAVWTLAFYPSTVFFSAVYTDALFCVLVLAALCSVRSERWLAAGIFGALAASTRNPGFLLTFVLLIEYVRRMGLRLKPSTLRDLIAISLPLATFSAFQLYLSIKFENWSIGVLSHTLYHRAFSWPWEPVWRDLYNAFQGVWTFNGLVSVGVVIAVFALITLHWNRQPVSYSFFTLAIMFLHLFAGRVIPTHSLPASRYMSTTPFPQLIGYQVSRMGERARIYFWHFYLLVAALEACAFGLKISIG